MPKSEQNDWIGDALGVDTSSYQPADSSDGGGGMSGVTPDGAGYSTAASDSSETQSASAASGDDAGMTGATSDGAPYSTQGATPDSSSSAPTDASGAGGGMSAATDDGAPYSSPDSEPDGSQAPPDDQGSAGGMSAVTDDGAPYSAQGTADDQSVDDTPAPAAGPADGDERGLTSGERAYAHEIFGDSLDYDVILINYNGLASTGASRTTGNTINLEAEEFVPGTFDLTGSGRETLVHEMTHVWQYQHDGWTYAPAALWAQLKSWASTGSRDGAYDWRQLDSAGTPWEEWNPEAQAAAVERYNQALRAVQGGKAQAADYGDLALLDKYIRHMQAGPAQRSADSGGADDGGAEGAGPGGPPAGGKPGADDEEGLPGL
jgi:hypothetical protein